MKGGCLGSRIVGDWKGWGEERGFEGLSWDEDGLRMARLDENEGIGDRMLKGRVARWGTALVSPRPYVDSDPD